MNAGTHVRRRVRTKSRCALGWAPACPSAHDGDGDAEYDLPRPIAFRPFKVYNCNVWSVDLEPIEEWLTSLDDDSFEQVMAAIELLEERGPQLGRPIVDTVKASRHKNMKELRPGSSGRSELRVLFAFDPNRQAILLVAGDKAGDWNNWYKKNVPVADDLFDAHIRELKKTKGV